MGSSPRQPDLGTKWMPRFVRIVNEMPLTASNKVQKQPLRNQRWEAPDPVFWQPERNRAYRPLTDDDVADLHAQFRQHGRAAVLTSPRP